ncbi:MAG TPA: hypothetical protein DHV51_00065 [Opitutae bacterium]|nr:hypothetical protein [Opitutae bacterium]
MVLFVLSMLTALTWFMGFCVRLSQKTPCTESCVAMDPKKVVAITAAVHSFLGDSVKVVSVQPSCNQKTN